MLGYYTLRDYLPAFGYCELFLAAYFGLRCSLSAHSRRFYAVALFVAACIALLFFVFAGVMSDGVGFWFFSSRIYRVISYFVITALVAVVIDGVWFKLC